MLVLLVQLIHTGASSGVVTAVV
eukprot:COSAG06_NODE_38591_length_422_cov_0.455108_1_plen_22_part_01